MGLFSRKSSSPSNSSPQPRTHTRPHLSPTDDRTLWLYPAEAKNADAIFAKDDTTEYENPNR